MDPWSCNVMVRGSVRRVHKKVRSPKPEDSNRPHQPQVSGGFLGVHRNTLKGLTSFQPLALIYLNSLSMTLLNLQKFFGEDLISGREFMGGNSPLGVASVRGELTTYN